MLKVNLFPVSSVSQVINHHGLRRVFTNKLRKSKQLSSNTLELNQIMTSTTIECREIRLNR